MMRTISIEYRNRNGKNGKTYKIPYTYDFGYAMSVSINGNLPVLQDAQGYFINYDPKYAEIRVNEKGFLVFHVTNAESAGF